MDAHAIEQGQVQIVHGSLSAIRDVPAARLAGKQDWKIIVLVLIAVAQAAAVDDLGMIEQRAVAIGNGFQLAEEIRELLHVISVYARDLFDEIRFAAVMSQGVMGVGNPDFAVGPGAAFAAEHEGGDARGAGLESDGQQVEHQAGVAGEFGGNAGGFFKRWWSLAIVILGELDTALDLAERREVFIDFLAVGCAELGTETPRVVQNIIQNACFIDEALVAIRGIFVDVAE